MRTAQTFKAQVSHKGFSSAFKSSGRISLITAALEAYEQAKNSNLPEIQQVACLYEVYKQCAQWLEAKKHKVSETTDNRRQHVAALKLEFAAELSTEFPGVCKALRTYMANRSHGANPNAQGPVGVYNHETKMYNERRQAGQFTPGAQRYAPSATLLHGEFTVMSQDTTDPRHRQFKKAVASTDFGQLTEGEFRKLDQMCAGQNVLYLSKIQRLQYMAIVEKGTVKKSDGALFDTGDNPIDSDLNTVPYAMDRYGNLFVTSLSDHRDQINHTTLCAGREVICAGTISIKKGKIVAISNNSGHYKPDKARLFEAVSLLIRQGAVDGKAKVVYQDESGFQEVSITQFLTSFKKAA